MGRGTENINGEVQRPKLLVLPLSERLGLAACQWLMLAYAVAMSITGIGTLTATRRGQTTPFEPRRLPEFLPRCVEDKVLSTYKSGVRILPGKARNGGARAANQAASMF